jgi:hypothetical protein
MQQEDIECVSETNTKLIKLGGIVESVAFLCILGNVIPGATLSSECTKTSPEGMDKVSDSCVS